MSNGMRNGSPHRQANGDRGGSAKSDPEKPGGLDREKVCPLLLRVFCSTSRHNPIQEYNRGESDAFLIHSAIFTRQVSSVIHSARPTVFVSSERCFARIWSLRTYGGRTCVKTMITTGRDCRSAERINISWNCVAWPLWLPAHLQHLNFRLTYCSYQSAFCVFIILAKRPA